MIAETFLQHRIILIYGDATYLKQMQEDNQPDVPVPILQFC